MRGNRHHRIRNQSLRGSIPARAGEPVRVCVWSSFDWVYPLALRVIAAAGVASTISKTAQDVFAYVRTIEGMIRSMLTDPQLSGAVLNRLSTMTAKYRTPFDFSSRAEYHQYVRDSELRTLNLDLN